MQYRESNDSKVFICYADEDEKKVKAILDALKKICNYKLVLLPASKRIAISNPIIENALKECRICIVFFSKASASARYISIEYNFWFKCHSEDPHHLFIPVELDKDNVPELISSTYQCIQFSDISIKEPWEFCDRVYDLADLLPSVHSCPPSSKVRFAIIAMTNVYAEELVSKEAFTKYASADKETELEFSEFKEGLMSIPDLSPSSLVNRYGNSPDEWCPFWSKGKDKKTIRTIIDEVLIDLKLRVSIIDHEYCTDGFFSDNTEEYEQVTSCIHDSGCIFIVDSISLFHPKIQDKYLKAQLSRNKKCAMVCISPLNALNFTPNMTIHNYLQSKLSIEWRRYKKDRDRHCVFQFGDEIALNHWLFNTLSQRFEGARSEIPSSKMKEKLESALGQQTGIGKRLFQNS